MKFQSLVNKILLEQNIITPEELANKFTTEVLSNYIYKKVGKGHLNCAWATYKFCTWCDELKIPSEAIYFVWPKPELVKKLKQNNTLAPYYEDEGMSHIAPIYKDKILDFTFGQFDNTVTEDCIITPVNSWKSRYAKYGYGTNEYPEGSKKTIHIDTYQNLKSLSDKLNLGITPMEPQKKNEIQ